MDISLHSRERVLLVHPALLWFMAVPEMEAGRGAVVFCALGLGSQLNLPEAGPVLWDNGSDVGLGHPAQGWVGFA